MPVTSALLALGRAMGKLRRMSSEFQRQFNDVLREAELDDVRKELDGLRHLDAAPSTRKQPAPVAAESIQLVAGSSMPISDVPSKATLGDESLAKPAFEAKPPEVPPSGKHTLHQFDIRSA